MFRNKNKTEEGTYSCTACNKNFYSDDPAIVMMDEHSFVVCDECAQVMEHIRRGHEKLLDREGDLLDE